MDKSLSNMRRRLILIASTRLYQIFSTAYPGIYMETVCLMCKGSSRNVTLNSYNWKALNTVPLLRLG